ncbi:MAG: hypothetical protein K0R10_694 [Alphaproteobacteria bacterium]|nr:hypothetical protein [Alphaproteobacteria bacterium]
MTRASDVWHRRWLPCLVAGAIACAAPLPFAFAQDTSPVAVRIGVHKQFTRVVFDFKGLTAYRVSRDGDNLVIVFDSATSFKIPADTEKLIRSIKTVNENDGTTRMTIALRGGATAKDFRIEKQIVIDLYPGKPAPKPAPQETASVEPKPAPDKNAADRAFADSADESKKPVKLVPDTKPVVAAAKPAEKPATVAKPEVKAEEVPPETVIDKQLDAQIAAVSDAIDKKMPGAPNTPASPVIVDAAPPADTAPPVAAASIQKPEPQMEPTVITISTIEPARLAVFTRFNNLWIVLDTEAAGAINPSASGTEAALLGNPRIIKMKGATGYHYGLPQQRYVSVERQNLTWRISLSNRANQMPAQNRINTVVDESTGHVKLMAEIKGASRVIEFTDPAVGDTLYAIASEDQQQRIDQPRRYADLEILPASIGMVVRPLSDNLKVTRLDNFVLISSPNGITATPGATAGPAAVATSAERAGSRDEARLFDFPNWRQGGLMQLDKNVRALQIAIAEAKKPEEKNALLMKLALLYFANNFGQETLGMLRLIETDTPEMAKNPNFIALRGAASAMAGHYDEAIADLSHPAIQQHGEVNLWVGYAAAATEQWRMANRAFPADNRLLLQYPENIAAPFTIYMAESALRLGNAERANALLASLDTMEGGFDPHYAAAIQYLKGEAARQMGNPQEAIRLWRPVAFGLDRLYHTKASLAMAMLRYQEKIIPAKTAIDELDSLRFAWRGDGLEIQVLQSLGRVKIADRKYLTGLEDLKTAALLADNLRDDSQPIKDEMARVFTDLFVNGGAKDVPPLEAVSIYSGFSAYMPEGEQGAIATLNFADNLITMDLLGKAAQLLEEQLRGGNVPQARVAPTYNKLAAVYLLDSLPEKALATLSNAGGDATPQVNEERNLLRARAMSQLNRPDDAIAALASSTSTDALKLKADVLWRARKWKEAAATLQGMLPDGDKGLTEADAQLVINTAVGYKLAGDTAGLADIKSRYLSPMDATSQRDTFRVVTRTGGSSKLSDRDTILKIAGEVDMFKGFLDSYKAGGKGS